MKFHMLGEAVIRHSTTTARISETRG